MKTQIRKSAILPAAVVYDFLQETRSTKMEFINVREYVS